MSSSIPSSSSKSASGVDYILQIDVEPYVLKQWKIDREQTANEYLDFVDKIVQETVPYGVHPRFDIPNWFTSLPPILHRSSGERKQLHKFVIDRADVVILDYINDADKAIRSVQDEMKYASQRQRKAVLAFETAPNTHFPTSTFHGLQHDQFETVLRKIDRHFSNPRKCPSYDGVAVHHYHSWRRMNPTLSIPSEGARRDVFQWDCFPVVREKQSQEFFQHMEPNKNHKKVRKLYLDCYYLLDTASKRRQLSSFIHQCHSEYGFQIQFLLGKTEWALSKNHDDALKYVRRVVKFLKEFQEK
eukprot:gb/GECH01012037.1/.p1 GENE.gb/GECH01012037.1/~~gb/GECH01012037.1/.p1  ORF type:complete len:301 (+),score=72.48 gb/GECH01012037.1/:1-903(+)